MNEQRTSHFEWIDMLRGLSAFAVVIFHVRVNLWCGWNEIHNHSASFSAFDRACALLSLPTPFFGSAVMLFFLLSGFCVHFPHAADGRPVVLSIYLRRRFLRIYPPYLAAILFTVLVEYITRLCFGTPSSSLLTILKSLFMAQNYGTLSGQMKTNPSLWSLPVEFELYLAYPLFWVVLLRYGLKASLTMAATTTILAVGLALNHNWEASSFHPTVNFAVYWIIWCTGATLAEKVKSGTLPMWQPLYGVVALGLLALAAVAQLRSIPVDIEHLLWASFYIFPLWWGLSHPVALQGVNSRFKKSLLFVGTISYSLYLVHFPFFYLCGQMWIALQGHKPTNFLIGLIFCALSLPVSYLFYLIVEVPSHHLSRAQNFEHAQKEQSSRSIA